MKNFKKYLRIALILTWVGGCVAGAAIPQGEYNLTEMGFMAFVILWLWN